MVALWALQIVTYVSRFTFVVPPDLVATTGTSTLVHVCDVIFLRCGLSLGMRSALWRGFARMRGLSEFCRLFGFRFFLRGLSARCRHDQSLA
jgi:hypothetical protein